MARIYPEVEPQTNSEAEQRVYRALTGLPDKYLVLHSVDITLPGKRESDADFVVATPEWGFVVLEVKGGGIRFDAKLGNWSSIDRNGQTHQISDPFAQAKTNAHTVNRMLQGTPSTSQFRYRFGHGVVFPDIRGKSAFTPEQRELILDAQDLRELPGSLERLLRKWGSSAWGRDAKLGKRAIDALEARFAQSIYAGPVLDVEGIAQGIIRLTNDQIRLLRALRTHREALIAGCAGSGKTFLAMEKAVWCYENGLRVLLVCFNRPLADWIDEQLRARLQQVRVTSGTGQVTVTTFHSLAARCARDLGRTIPDDVDPHDRVWAECVLDAGNTLGDAAQFDAIIVDEGQDFVTDWWISLDDLRRPEGYWYIFFDDNQRIYADPGEWPIRSEPYYLPKNVRFTRPIHEHVIRLYEGQAPDPPDVDGEAPEFHLGDGIAGDKRLLRKVLHGLIHDDGFDPSDVVLLTPVAQEKSQLKEDLRVGNLQLTWDKHLAAKGQQRILVSTIQRFKGLERHAVVLAEVESMALWRGAEWETRRSQLLYIGMSRASMRLVVLGGQEQWFEVRPAWRRRTTVAQMRSVSAGQVSSAAPEGWKDLPDAVYQEDGSLGGEDDARFAPGEEHGAAMDIEGLQEEIDSAVADDGSLEAVEAVFMERALEQATQSPGVQSAVELGKAILVEDPAGILILNTRLPEGPLVGVERLRKLPFTPDAWVVRVTVRLKGQPIGHGQVDDHERP